MGLAFVQSSLILRGLWVSWNDSCICLWITKCLLAMTKWPVCAMCVLEETESKDHLQILRHSQWAPVGRKIFTVMGNLRKIRQRRYVKRSGRCWREREQERGREGEKEREIGFYHRKIQLMWLSVLHGAARASVGTLCCTSPLSSWMQAHRESMLAQGWVLCMGEGVVSRLPSLTKLRKFMNLSFQRGEASTWSGRYTRGFVPVTHGQMLCFKSMPVVWESKWTTCEVSSFHSFSGRLRNTASGIYDLVAG